MFGRILGLLFLCQLIFPVTVMAEKKPAAKAEKKPAPIFQRAFIEDNGAAFVAYADLGALDAGTTVEATLSLVNDSDFSFPILKMQTSCSCIKVTSEKSEIPAHGSLDFAFSVDVQRNAKEPELTMRFSVFFTETKAIEVYVKYEIAGLVSFKNVLTQHTTAAVGAKSHSFQIPVLITKPVKLGQLEIIAADSLKALRIVPKEDAGGQRLECSLPIDPSSSDSLIGRVWMKHPITGELSEISLVIEINTPYSIAPSVLQFKPTDLEKNTFEASGILRINSPSPSETSKAKTSVVDFEWRVDQGALQFTKKKISDNIYRLYFSWRPTPKESESKAEFTRPQEIKGRIMSSQLKADLTLPLSFGNLAQDSRPQ